MTSPVPTMTRLVMAAALLLLGVAALQTAQSARADTISYWSLWEGDSGQWVSSQTGANDIKVKDQSVVAAKYVETEGELTDQDAPTESADFAELCPDGADADGDTDGVQVGVVVDFGTTSIDADAPETTVNCIVVANPATAATAFQQVAQIDATEGFITAVDGFPPTTGTTPSASAEPETGNTEPEAGTTGVDQVTEEESGIKWVPTVLGVGILAALVIVVVLRTRGRKDDQQP